MRQSFECKKVDLYGNSEFKTLPEHVLAYLPALDRYFDPTLQITKQLEESGAMWVEEKPRCHYPFPVGVSGWAFRGKDSEPPK